MDSLVDAWAGVWSQLTSATPVPGEWPLVIALAAGIVAAAWRRTWQVLHKLITVSHEGGHAIAALVTGRRVLRVRIRADGSGETHTWGRPGGFGGALVTFAGYPFPAIVGGGLLIAVASGSARLWSALAALALVVLLTRTRNIHGWVVVGLWLAGFAAAAWYVPGDVLALGIAFLGAFLIAGAGRSLLAELRTRRRGASGSDVASLGRSGPLPAGVWWVAMFALVLGCGWVAWEQLAANYAGA